jgi:ankyrin repeat protein
MASDPQIIDLLCDAGAKIEAQDALGFSPLHRAVGSPDLSPEQSAKCVEKLLQRNASPHARNNLGRTPLYYVHNPAAIDLLCDAGADVNVQDRDRNTPLHHFLFQGRLSLECIEKLLQKGARVDIENANGDTVLSLVQRVIQDGILYSFAKGKLCLRPVEDQTRETYVAILQLFSAYV